MSGLEEPGARIDEVDLAAVPAGVAHGELAQVRKHLRDLEAHAVHAETVPSLRRCVRWTWMRKWRRKVAESGQSRNTLGPAMKRCSGVAPPNSRCALAWYSYSIQAKEAAFSCCRVRLGTASSIAIRRASTRFHNVSCLPFIQAERGGVVSASTPRWCRPALNSPAIMAEPLSLYTVRGKPRRCRACERSAPGTRCSRGRTTADGRSGANSHRSRTARSA